MRRMRMERTWLPVIGLCLGVLLVSAELGTARAATQTGYRLDFGDPEGSIERKLIWRRAVQVERERTVLEAWVAAGPEGRAGIEAVLEEGVDPRRSRNRLLPMEYLSRAARRYLHAGEDPARTPWLDLVDSVDLRVVPGAFNARSEGRGEPTTVRLTSIWDSLAQEMEDVSFEVRLIWTSPAGEESVARRELASTRNLEEGFDMFIRPPLSEPGTWTLSLELDSPAGTVRSGDVPVECVRDLRALNERLTGEVSSPLQADLKSRLDLLLNYGIRPSSGTSLASWIADLADPGRQTPGLHARDGAGFGVPGQVLWELSGLAEPQGILLVLAKENESPIDIFNGRRMDAWRDLAERCSLRILAGSLSLSILSGEPLDACLAALKTKTEGPLFLVARGESGRLAPSAVMQIEDLPLEGLILSETLGAGANLAQSLECATLQLISGLAAVGQEPAPAEEGSLRSRELLPAQDPVAAYQATERMRDWILSL